MRVGRFVQLSCKRIKVRIQCWLSAKQRPLSFLVVQPHVRPQRYLFDSQGIGSKHVVSNRLQNLTCILSDICRVAESN